MRGLYRGIIEQWLSNGHGTEWFENFLNHLLTGNLPAFEADFRHLVEDTFSVHDTAKDPEAFYHGFMVGATASLYHNKNYEIKSNRESGYGRYDYLIFSHDITKPTILMEIKRVKRTEKMSADDLDKILTANRATSLSADSTTKLFIGSATARQNEYTENWPGLLRKTFPNSGRKGEFRKTLNAINSNPARCR